MSHKWIEQIDDLSIQFSDTFGSLSNEQLNWQPNSDSWSIGQIMEHLINVGQSYEPTFRKLKDGTYKAPFISKIGFLVNFIGKTILGGSGTDRKKRIRTFPIWEPSASDISQDVLARFEKTQLNLQEWIRDSDQDVKDGTVITSPASGKIVYKLEMALDIIVAHEKRHLEQAKEVLALMESGSSAVQE